MTRRPWKVWVADIGPTFSFATEERAHQRAADLIEVERYAKVLVFSVEPHQTDIDRTRYGFDHEPVHEVLELDPQVRWVEVPR